jgi:hypothetical protein
LLNYSKIIGDTNVPAWCESPESGDLEYASGMYLYARIKGFEITAIKTLIDWQFNYCTVKYW